jgi:Fic family protein
MIRDIKKKMVILSRRMPFSNDVKAFMNHLEKKEWVYRNLKMEGSRLTPEQTENLLTGQYVLAASVWEHLMVQRLEKILASMYDFISRRVDIDLKLINTFHNLLSADNADLSDGYRKKSMVITEYDYIPLIPAEIPSAMKKLQMIIDKKNKITGDSVECFDAAAEIHNEILRILPYGGDDKILARVLMTYFLMERGYPAVIFDMSEEEYNNAVFKGLRDADYSKIREAMLKAVLERTDLMMQLTDY